MVKPIIFCQKHNCDKVYLSKHKKYECIHCKREYVKIYKIKNLEILKEKNKLYNQLTRQRRQEWVKQDRLNNPDRYKKYAKEYSLKDQSERKAKRTIRKYGLTLEQYKKMILDCDNRCNICRLPETRQLGRDDCLTKLSIDHNHDTNKVRELLCHSCNQLIGNSKESIGILEIAIEYLKKHQHV